MSYLTCVFQVYRATGLLGEVLKQWADFCLHVLALYTDRTILPVMLRLTSVTGFIRPIQYIDITGQDGPTAAGYVITALREMVWEFPSAKEGIGHTPSVEENAGSPLVAATSIRTVLYVETPSGKRFEAKVPIDMTVGKLAADFFESQGWADLNKRGRRAIVELINPEDDAVSRRLPLHMTVSDAGIRTGDTVRIFPESIAGCFP